MLRSSAAAFRRTLSTSPQRASNPGLVVFDKDGTLIDFQMMWGSWTEQFAWRLEMVSKTQLREELFQALGYDYMNRRVFSGGALCCTPMRNLRNLAERVLEDSELRLTRDQAVEMVNGVWEMPDPVKSARPLTDLRTLFNTLRGMNMKIAVCTTDDNVAAVNTLKAFEVLDMVDCVVGGDDPIPSKPHAEQIYHICHKCGVAPHDTIMVGDTNTDMKLGRNSGCGLTIGVLDGASNIPDLAENADALIPNIDRIPRIAYQWSLRAQMVGQSTQGFSKEDHEKASQGI